MISFLNLIDVLDQVIFPFKIYTSATYYILPIFIKLKVGKPPNNFKFINPISARGSVEALLNVLRSLDNSDGLW